MSDATTVEQDAQSQQAPEGKPDDTTTTEKTATKKKTTAKKTTTKKASGSGSKSNGSAQPAYDEGKQTGTILEVPIASIIRYDNPRKEPENLFQMGFTLIGDPDIDEVGYVEDEDSDDYGKAYYTVGEEQTVLPEGEEVPEDKFVSLFHLATNKEYAQYYVDLIEEYEHIPDRQKAPIEEQCAPQTIVELAMDIADMGQLVPILVRKEKEGYVGIDGGRRIAAILYLHALNLCGKSKKKVASVVKATTDPCKQGDVFLHSIKANLSRKEFTPLQEGLIYHQMMQQTNPDTGRKWNMKDAAKELRVNYGTFRNREALWHDYDPATGKGLTDTQRQKVASGEWGLTAASRKALGEKQDKESPDKKPKHKVKTLKEMQDLFDATAEGDENRRKAIADCMNMTLKQAVKESDTRIERQDTADVRRNVSKRT